MQTRLGAHSRAPYRHLRLLVVNVGSLLPEGADPNQTDTFYSRTTPKVEKNKSPCPFSVVNR